jgi:hypothetical protein
MAITTRQTSLLVQQDWTKIYQTFREADFQSFDFETLRKSMLEYLRTYYPEDFNDFTESSEYIALIDLIAFLGQSLSFRADLNARENFLDTAERRDSILKLAKLISYNPKRSIPAAGFLKFESVTTSESVFDSIGNNLANTVINWNDNTNSNWLEQFTAILNASLLSSQIIGKPGSSKTINDVKTDEYTVNVLGGLAPVYGYNASIAGVNFPFEVVSATSVDQDYIYENDPRPGLGFNFLYKNDNQGNASNNTGYFFYFKQGELKNLDFNIAESLPNRIVNVNFDNINNSDIWLFSLNSSGSADTVWTKIPSVYGVNVIYNNSSQKNLYSVNTRANDQIDLIFGDGSFTNIPIGNFRLYYRVSNNLTYKITPDEMTSVTIVIPYKSRSGRVESLTVRASLKYTVTNATARETLEEIRTKAPQQYYTQNRMITGEDYNILPYTTFNSILKVKAVNRSSSGISRYLDVVDATGKYSSTNIFAQDGIIYQEDQIDTETFQFTSSTEARFITINTLLPLITTVPTKHLYYKTATRQSPIGVTSGVATVLLNKAYQIVTAGTTDFISFGAVNNTVGTVFIATKNGTSGDGSGTVALLPSWTKTSSSLGRSTGTFSSPSYTYLKTGALVKFTAPTGKYFDAQNQLQTGTPNTEYEKTFIWASIQSYNLPGSGPATLSKIIPTGAVVSEIVPVFANDWSSALINDIVNRMLSRKNFGIRYNIATMTWVLIEEENLNTGAFDLAFAGDTSATGKDASWFVRLEYQNQSYVATSRGINYFFQSVRETRFYFDPDVQVYDSKTATTKIDKITLLRSNTLPDSADSLYYSQEYQIWNKVIDADGYDDNRKIAITFPDNNADGIPDDPDLFARFVQPTVNSKNKLVFFVLVSDEASFFRYDPLAAGTIVVSYANQSLINLNKNNYEYDTVFYATDEAVFYKNTVNGLVVVTEYIARTGRQDVFFQYEHNAPNNRRIDPSPNNLIDLFILTKDYANQYTSYITDTSGTITEPTAPSGNDLKTEYNSIENFKSISDSLIYNNAKFKPLFGNKAEIALQAVFKVVKNPTVNISDNDVKTSVISAINNYFDINNWDFGETFYFSELSAYLHSALSPNISSIVIVPADTSSSFGNLYQINAEPNEILISAATVDNVQIINAITAGQLNIGT